MVERLNPQAGNARLDTLWDQTRHTVTKLALLQEGSPMLDPRTLSAWKQGHFEKAIGLIYEDTTYGDFLKTAAKKYAEGVRETRIHLIAEGSLSKDNPGYLDLLIEMFRRRNIPEGKEHIYLLPWYMCGGLEMPPTDIALFDNNNLVVTNYHNGKVAEREIYNARDPHDNSVIQEQRELLERIRSRLDLAHELRPVEKGDTTTWRETAGKDWLE